MSMFEKTLDLDLAPARKSVAGRLMEAVAAPFEFLRAMRNRREVTALADFTDEQLADIGLTRADVRASLSGSRFSDPSGYLIAQAGYRRPVIRRR
jgi:uncharacterized protein YjiS (DUF1127 family)